MIAGGEGHVRTGDKGVEEEVQNPSYKVKKVTGMQHRAQRTRSIIL